MTSENQNTPVAEEPAQQKDQKAGLGRFVLAFCGAAAAIIMVIAGILMLRIHSISGDSIAELFYHAFGWGFIGFGILAGGIAVSLSSNK
jgi:hypothetical protein